MKDLRCMVGRHDRYHWGVMATHGRDEPSQYVWRCTRCELSELSNSPHAA